MPSRARFWFALYAALSLAEIAARAARPEWEPFLKPLCMPALMTGFWHAARSLRALRGETVGGLELWVLLAFAFSWLGDVALLETDDSRFLLGLSAFLVAHLAYVVAAFRAPHEAGGWPSAEGRPPARLPGAAARRGLAAIPWAVVPVALFAGLLMARLWPGLGALRVPVAVYATVIAGMCLASLNRYRRVPPRSFSLVAAGAVIFMLSDSMIAWNRFAQPFDAAGPLIMITYLGAQALFAAGFLAQLRTGRSETGAA
jgi:uncharacterized membrane protein YhhN